MFGFGKKKTIDLAFESLHQSHLDLFSRIRKNQAIQTEQIKLVVSVACLEGASEMAGYLISRVDHIRDAFGEGTQKKSDQLLKILALKMAYTMLWTDLDTKALLLKETLQGSEREKFILADNAILPIAELIDVICDPPEKQIMTRELILLEKYYSVRMKNVKSKSELNVLHTKILSILDDRNIDISSGEFTDLSEEVFDVILDTQVANLSLEDRMNFQLAEENAADAMLATIRGEHGAIG